ncbi:MAG: UvrD-helicase domain-containing protein [Thermodesulfobacteriota bacterium]
MKSEATFIDPEHRDRAAQEISESYIVEAAAGTGKTTVLVTRIINLIKAGEARLEEIVAITFTEKAAAELKVKLRQEMEKAIPNESNSGEDQRISEAISDLERMQVTTIHSFCGSLLRERPVEAGLDPNFEVADDLTSSLVQDEVWEGWLEKQMDLNDPALRRAVLIGITPEQMRKISQFVLENRDVLKYLPSPPPPEDVEKAIGQFIKSFQKGVSSLEGLKQHCKNPEEDKAAQKIEQLSEQFLKLKSLPPEEKGFFIFKEISIGSSKPGNQKNWESKGHLEDVREEIDQLSKTHEQVRCIIADSVMTTLAERITDYTKAYEQAKRERNLLDFNDLLMIARNMLKEHPQVRKHFRDRYKFLLVDEFQDTDPLQAEIVFFLSEQEDRKAKEWKEVQVSAKRLFLVGDPKQSIYRFRRADIEMYEEAKSRMGEGRLLNISQNFRCAPSIVRWVNRIFQDLIKPPEDGQYQPGYVPLHFGRKKATVPSEHGIVLLYPPKNKNLVIERTDDCRLWESRCIASFIQKLVAEERWQVWDDSEQSFRPIMFRDIAILMRTYTPLNSLEEALRSYEVDYRVVGGKYFYKRQEVQQLLAVLQAIDNPSDKMALVAALRSPFFGVSDEELFMFHAGGGNLNYLQEAQRTSLEQPFNLLRELHGMRNQASVAALLKKLYEATRGLVLFLLKPQGEQRVANLMKIGDVARALEERGMLSFRGFVHWLSEREEEEVEEEEPPTLERGDNFVRLLTIYRAKGLEFPMVILADLAHKGGKREDFIIDRNGERIAIKVGDKKNRFWTRNYEEMSEWEKKRGEAEERRVLYVGMTRARDFLVLPVYWVKEKKGEKEVPKESYLGYVHPYLTVPDKVSYGKWNEDLMFYDTNQLELEPKETAPFRSPLNPEMKAGEASKLVLSQREKWKETQEELKKQAGIGRAITTATEKVSEVERDDEWMISPVTKGEGAIFGKLVHRLFERMDWNQPGWVERMAEIEGKALGATESMIKRAGQMIREAMDSPLLQRVIKVGSYQKEVPFTYKNNGTIIEGVIDVVFREGNDLVVLDFKTDLVKKEDLSSKIEHYQPQVRIYSDAIQNIFGKPPKEVILFFLHLMEPVSITSRWLDSP